MPAAQSTIDTGPIGHGLSAIFWPGPLGGNFGAALSPVLLTAVRDRLGWDAVFLTCAGTFTAAGVCGLLTNASRPLGAGRVRA